MKILTIQNRMGIGDMVIFLPFIEAIANKFNTPVSLLVKENSKASHFLDNNKNIKDIIILDRDNEKKNGIHDGFLGSIKLIKELKNYNFDKVFIFNSSLRFKLICQFASIKSIHQYPLFKKKKQHLILTAQNFLNKELNIQVNSNPYILINDKDAQYAKSKYNFSPEQKNILLGIGGSGETKRIPSKIFLKFMEYCTKEFECKFFLATGGRTGEQKILNEILNTKFKKNCIRLDKLEINKTLPIIKNCDISICNDSSFSHLSAAIKIPTIVLMADTPILYGSYSPQMFPIIPDNVKTVGHNTLGKNNINPEKIFKKFKEIIY